MSMSLEDHEGSLLKVSVSTLRDSTFPDIFARRDDLLAKAGRVLLVLMTKGTAHLTSAKRTASLIIKN